ncbi:hypothetical protein BGZ72_002262, partial [Mortierella alpina]
MAGKNFFTAPETEDDDPVFVDDVVFPKNPEQHYHAPSLVLPWPYKAKSHQSFDASTWAQNLQERLLQQT